MHTYKHYSFIRVAFLVCNPPSSPHFVRPDCGKSREREFEWERSGKLEEASSMVTDDSDSSGRIVVRFTFQSHRFFFVFSSLLCLKFYLILLVFVWSFASLCIWLFVESVWVCQIMFALSLLSTVTLLELMDLIGLVFFLVNFCFECLNVFWASK